MTPRFIVRRAASNSYRALENSANITRFRARVTELRSLGVNVGVPAGAREPESGVSLALVAAANHFGAVIPIRSAGAPGRLAAPRTGAVVVIPERPFMTVGIREGRPLFRRLNESNLGRVLRGEMTPLAAIGQLGAAAVGSVQTQIRRYGWTPNAPSTIRAKGSSQPLVNTGHLWQSITYEVTRV